MHTSVFTKPAAAVALAALALFGVTACSSGGSGAASSGSSASSGKPTPKVGLSTKVQCAELNAKMNDSVSGLQSAISDMQSGGDVNSAIPKLQSFETELHTQVGKVTDPALKQAAGKLDTDFGAMITTMTTLLGDVSAGNTDDAQTQLTQLQSQQTALQGDETAFEKVCSL